MPSTMILSLLLPLKRAYSSLLSELVVGFLSPSFSKIPTRASRIYVDRLRDLRLPDRGPCSNSVCAFLFSVAPIPSSSVSTLSLTLEMVPLLFSSNFFEYFLPFLFS